jgi:hypothetical protein
MKLQSQKNDIKTFKLRNQVAWAWQHIAVVGLSCVVGSLDRKTGRSFFAPT